MALNGTMRLALRLSVGKRFLSHQEIPVVFPVYAFLDHLQALVVIAWL